MQTQKIILTHPQFAELGPALPHFFFHMRARWGRYLVANYGCTRVYVSLSYGRTQLRTQMSPLHAHARWWACFSPLPRGSAWLQASSVSSLGAH